MRLFVLSLILAVSTTSLLLDRTPRAAHAQGDAVAKAQSILAQARAALGNEAKWKALQSLSISGNVRRSMGERQMEGELQLEMLLPDKIMRTEVISPMAGIEITRTEVLNGTDVWVDQNSGHGGGGNVVIRRAGDDSPQGRELANKATRIELLRQSLALLLSAPASAGTEFSFAGEAEAADGKANVIEVKVDGAQLGRLFVDQKSNRLLMLTYQGRKPRMVMSQRSGPPSEAEMQKHTQELEAQANNPTLDEFQMRFSDYRDEGGISFPHHIVKSVADEVTEEIQLSKFKINPTLKADKFVQKK
ncbi:MAG: hypothetical protein HYR56_30125 [Acidobacteria bacterium]|nr:hypothetical protein [Acidobacteriota bacterium]MBI3423930.1 hypothetical protein [Acidobacteriota bacterium]